MTAETQTVDVAGRERELRARALERIRRRRNFVTHLFAYFLGSVLVTLVWASSEYQNAGGWPSGLRTGRANHDWDPWIVYPVLVGAIALAVHAWVAFGRKPVSARELAAEMDRLR